MERRLSSSSEASSGGTQDPTSPNRPTEAMEFIPTRMTKITAPKPAANPLQFVKVGPCDLFKSAQETLRKVEEVKKMKKEVREDAEEWQSNLDNWKCSRRKRVEHIIDRVVEVKKLELEEHERNRRRAKTFNEMMEERNSRGRRASLLVHKDDDSNDLSDLGIGTSSDKSSVSEDYGNEDNHSMEDADETRRENGTVKTNGKVNGKHEDDTSTVSSPEPEEYTYDRAIQGYVNFTETRVKKTNGAEPQEAPGAKRCAAVTASTPAVSPRTPTEAEKAADIERVHARKQDSSPPRVRNGTAPKVTVKPSVPVLRRKQLFEKGVEEAPKIAARAADDLANSQSIRDRLSHLERQKADDEKPKSVKRLSGEISVKDRLSFLEKQKSSENLAKSANGRNPSDLPLGQSVRERLSSLGQAVTPEDVPKVFPDRDPTFQDKLATFRNTECTDAAKDARSPSPESEDMYKRHFHRSLDSLDVDSESQASNDVLERVRSLEDLGRHGPASASSNENFVFSSQSGDTDREDSGIHTTDVSCSVSQADEPADFDSELGHTSPPVQQSKIPDSYDDVQQEIPVVNEARKPLLNVAIIVSSVSDASVVVPSGGSGGHAHVDMSLPTIPEIQAAPPMVVVTDTNVENPEFAQQSRLTEETFVVEDPTGEVTGLAEKVEDLAELVEDSDEKVEDSAEKVEDSTEKVEESTEEATSGILSPFSTGVVEAEKMEQLNGLACDPKIEEGPKPFSPLTPSLNERDAASLTSLENDADVSSFLDQALLIEDLLTTRENGPQNGITDSLANGLSQKDGLQSPENFYNCGHTKVPNNLPIVTGCLTFALSPPSSAEPPKEKPPPPPMDSSDEESPVEATRSLHRLDSTKRLKKEIRQKRSNFLGIEGIDDSYLDPELKVTPPPDMITLLQEERRLEQQLYRQTQSSLSAPLQSSLSAPLQSCCSESDQGSSQGESRDSGVELDSHQPSGPRTMEDGWDRATLVSPDQSSEPHSRQNSEPFGNTSCTSEEDEVVKKEREIIEILEKEEQWRSSGSQAKDGHRVGESLAAKLRELEQDKMRLEWERAEEARLAARHQEEEKMKIRLEWERAEEARRAAENEQRHLATEQAARREEQRRIMLREQQLRQQEGHASVRLYENVFGSQEELREERERLHREQEKLERQRQRMNSTLHHSAPQPPPKSQPIHRSLQDVSAPLPATTHRSLQDVSGEVYPMKTSKHPSPLISAAPLSATSRLQAGAPRPSSQSVPPNYRLSLPDLQQQADVALRQHQRRAPLPIPPAKPLASLSKERRSVDDPRHERILSNESLPTRVNDPLLHRHNSVGLPAVPTATQQLSRQSLQALSAAPRSKIISPDTWVQAKRKPEAARNANGRDSCNYQHWLIQEAEHRRITEQQQRTANYRKSLPPQPTQAAPTPAQVPQAPQVPPHPRTSTQPHQWNQYQPSVPVPVIAPQPRQEKPLPDSVIQTLTQRAQGCVGMIDNSRVDGSPSRDLRTPMSTLSTSTNNISDSSSVMNESDSSYTSDTNGMLSVSGRKKCSHCMEELGRGAAMIIESLRLFYHMECFKCCVCHVQLGDGLMGTDVRVRNHKLHCHNCYSSEDGVKFSCV